MATLYKRATPPQAMMLRIVEGAIKNSCDAHGIPFDPYFARSIAKRAAGTLSAEMPAVLAAKPSEKIGTATHATLVARSARKGLTSEAVRGSEVPRGQRLGRSHVLKASPLRILEKWMFQQMRGIKLSGNDERAQAFIDVLRKISAMSRSHTVDGAG